MANDYAVDVGGAELGVCELGDPDGTPVGEHARCFSNKYDEKLGFSFFVVGTSAPRLAPVDAELTGR